MVVSILVGFKYEKEGLRFLPRITIDLYQVYNYVKKFSDQVYVITDIKDNEKNSGYIFQASNRGVVSSKVLYFISNIKSCGEYIEYIGLEALKNSIKTLLIGQDKVFFYYTGHGTDDNLLLPNNVTIDYNDLRDLFLDNTKINSQLFFVLDCCRGPNFQLPYFYKNRYHLTNKKDRKYFNQKIIMLTSSKKGERSLSTPYHASLFTTSLIKTLNKGEINLKSITDVIREECIAIKNNLDEVVGDGDNGNLKSIKPSTISLYLSFPNIKLIWYWMREKNDLGYDIEYHKINKCLMIKKN